MEKGLVTVVIPVYKTEKYLNQCVQSVVDQTFRNLEILLIDDGSPDRCPQMCDEWAVKDDRIRVFHKKNAGLGMARNTGIENARGEYICFFDSDDYIDRRTIEKGYAAATSQQVEIAVFGFHTVDVDGSLLSTFIPRMEKDTYRGDEVQSIFLPELIAPDPRGDGQRRLYMSTWVAMFSMEMVVANDWRFLSEREVISEDVYALLELYASVKSVTVVSEAFYFYRTNAASLSRSYKPKRYEAIRHFYNACIEVCEIRNLNSEVRKRLQDPFLAFTRAAIKQEAVSPLSVREKRSHIRSILADETLQEVLRLQEKDHTSFRRRLFFFAMRHKYHDLCFALAAVQSFRKGKK